MSSKSKSKGGKRSNKASPSTLKLKRSPSITATNNLNNNNNSNNDNHNRDEASEKVKYCKTSNRELKLHNINRELQVEIEQARESRISNKLLDNIENKKEFLNKGYKIKNLVGSGSYAHVFKARDINNKRDVALKLIELDKCSKHYKENFLRSEIHVIRQLNHENIVMFYEAFNMVQAYVMVMEFVENGTFADLLYQNGAFSEKLARKLFRGLGNGMNYMHMQCIAHRDLKLENLLLTTDLVPKISDFSLSLIWDRKKLCTNWCGTPPYFSPEILQKKPYNPLLYDVWSLGVCLYVIINDTIPFVCNDDQVMLQKQLKREWKFRAKFEPLLSNNLKNLIRQMLEPEPSQRITLPEIVVCKWLASVSVYQEN